MKQWDLNIRYGTKLLKLKAEAIYESNQVQRIRIKGKNRSITLQNNYPFLLLKGSKAKALQWKMIEGSMSDAQLLMNIIQEMESIIKKENPIR